MRHIPESETATEALQRLHGLKVDVKILTGDNEIISAYICKEVGLPVEQILFGSQVETLSEADLAEAASAAVLAAISPHAAVLRGPDPVGEDRFYGRFGE